ncbi:MAG: hypothetical protein U0234_04020 [Sandaracinus sp.]
MGHHIQGFVATLDVLTHAAALGLRHSPIALAQGLAWVPVSEEALDRLAETGAWPEADWDDRFVTFGSVAPALLATLSAHGPVAYIETEYFGGVGTQAATAFVRGERVLEHGTVNDALRAIGVRAAPGLDEWDTVGLAAHRHMPSDA